MAQYFGSDRHVWAWGIGLVFALLACIQSFISIYLTYHHTSPAAPTIRKYVIQVLFMVPMYSTQAFLGLVLKNQTQYYDVIRECYEAFAIYSFYMFLVSYLGGRVHLAKLMEKKPQETHKFPFKYFLKPWDMKLEFYRKTKMGALQYVPVKLAMAIVTFVFTNINDSEGNPLYNNGDFSPTNFYPWVAFITNASQIMAMYCLILFYVATKPELYPITPLGKFMCIKAVVFFTFWQSIIISFFVSVKVIDATTTYSQDQAAEGLQDFLICIEMFFASIAHWYCFPYLEFADYTTPPYLDKLNEEIVDPNGAKSDQDHYNELPSPDADDRRMDQMEKERKSMSLGKQGEGVLAVGSAKFNFSNINMNSENDEGNQTKGNQNKIIITAPDDSSSPVGSPVNLVPVKEKEKEKEVVAIRKITTGEKPPAIPIEMDAEGEGEGQGQVAIAVRPSDAVKPKK